MGKKRRRTCPNRNSRYCWCLLGPETCLHMFRRMIGESFTAEEIDFWEAEAKYWMS